MTETIMGHEEILTRKRQSEGETNTTLQVSIELREQLKQRGKKGETYEDVIWRILQEADEKIGKGARASK
jgi:hypothetical protein